MVLLEEVCHWGRALGVAPLPTSSLVSLPSVVNGKVSSQLAPAARPAAVGHASPPRWSLIPLEPKAKINSCL